MKHLWKAFAACALIAGCAGNADPATDIPVSISARTDGDDATAQRASVTAGEGRKVFDYVTAVIAAVDRHCGPGAGASHAAGNLHEFDAQTELPAGTQLWSEFRCHSLAAPNLRAVPAGALDAELGASVPGQRVTAWTSFDPALPKDRHLKSRDLIGGMIRDAYVEACMGKPMTIERISSLEEPMGGIEGGTRGRVGIAIDYRCGTVLAPAGHG